MARLRKIDGAKVQFFRESMEMWPTQEEAAKAVGIHRNSWSEIENGKRPYPHRATIFAMARYLGVSPNDLLEDAGSGAASSEGDARDGLRPEGNQSAFWSGDGSRMHA